MELFMGRLAFPLAVAAALAVLLIGARSFAFRLLHRWADRTETELDDLVFSALRKRIFARLRQEGVEIPFPQRTVHLRERA